MKKSFSSRLLAVLPSLSSIAIGIVIGWFLLFVTNPANSFGGLLQILAGGFGDGFNGIGQMHFAAMPIILTGLSVGFAFKVGLFNIGASGQYTAGAIAAVFVATRLEGLPSGTHVLLSILAGTLAGMVVGALSGVLKVLFRVNEVISGIMLNYIVMFSTNIVIKKYAYNEALNRSTDVLESAKLKGGIFERILPEGRLAWGMIIALILVIVIDIVLKKTKFGYELIVTGKNAQAALYAGMNSKRNLILSMLIAGGLCGIAGALTYISDYGTNIEVSETVLSQGFMGISVALLGMSDPIGVLIAAMFIAHIYTGGSYLQLYGYTSDVADMIIAVIVFGGALVIPVRMFFERLFEKKNSRKGGEQ